MNEKLAEINVTVVSKTKEILEGIAETAGLSVGEVIDRMVLKLCPENVDDAHLLILENILITTKCLTREQLDETMLKVLKVLESACVGDEPNELTTTLKRVVDKLNNEVS